MKKLLIASVLGCASLSAIEPTNVLDYWFGSPSEREANPMARAPIWFQGGEQVDQGVRARFSEALHEARYGALLDWRNEPHHRLALVILLDQFSRNIYRGSPEAFATDSLALTLVLDGISCGDDLKLSPVERLFFYMSLQHAEDRAIQNLSIQKYQQLLDQSPPAFRPSAEGSLEFAKRHQVIIERFGRFPHRNAALGRQSTPEEEAFLQEPNSSF